MKKQRVSKNSSTSASRNTRRKSASKNASVSQTSFAPVSMSRAVQSGRNPRITSTGGATRISSSEFFTSVIANDVDYHVQTFPCNPGVASMFPWLSQVAQRYETYKFRRICFDYHTRGTTTQVGTVGMVFDFDAKDNPPPDQMTALLYHDRSAASPWKEQSLVLDLAQGDRLPTHYVRPGLPTGQFDIRTSDLGNLHVFVDGVAESTNLGILEVSYVVDLYTPQAQDGCGGQIIGGSVSVDRTHPLGANYTNHANAILPFTVAPDGGSLSFDQKFAGTLLLEIVGTGLNNPTGFAFDNSVTGTASSMVVLIGNVAGASFLALLKIKAVPGALFVLDGSNSTSISYCSIWVGRCDYDQL